MAHSQIWGRAAEKADGMFEEFRNVERILFHVLVAMKGEEEKEVEGASLKECSMLTMVKLILLEATTCWHSSLASESTVHEKTQQRVSVSARTNTEQHLPMPSDGLWLRRLHSHSHAASHPSSSSDMTLKSASTRNKHHLPRSALMLRSRPSSDLPPFTCSSTPPGTFSTARRTRKGTKSRQPEWDTQKASGSNFHGVKKFRISSVSPGRAGFRQRPSLPTHRIRVVDRAPQPIGLTGYLTGVDHGVLVEGGERGRQEADAEETGYKNRSGSPHRRSENARGDSSIPMTARLSSSHPQATRCRSVPRNGWAAPSDLSSVRRQCRARKAGVGGGADRWEYQKGGVRGLSSPSADTPASASALDGRRRRGGKMWSRNNACHIGGGWGDVGHVEASRLRVLVTGDVKTRATCGVPHMTQRFQCYGSTASNSALEPPTLGRGRGLGRRGRHERGGRGGVQHKGMMRCGQSGSDPYMRREDGRTDGGRWAKEGVNGPGR
ncbi:hypothetical protein R3P38DRAFT_3376984 [Favolaschia claudopus]|uniref:Uncharacterized protein n=1 Tax=Favolaschia claudopus TaxID=2862362 RepID=A0AAV9ZD22_9AGAR